MNLRAGRILRKTALFLTLSLYGLGFNQCITEADTLTYQEAYTEIGTAIDYKAGECGHRPAYPLVLPTAADSYGTRLCSLTIIRRDCPFNDYPTFCLEMYNQVCDGCDVPKIGPE